MSIENLARRNGFILLAIFGIVIGLSGVGLLIAPKPITGCNPTIDGVWNESDKWGEAKWTFIEYIIPDPEHLPANNYFYVHMDEDYLYICADLVSDITGESDPEEWFSIWIDTDDSDDLFDFEDWNENVDMQNGINPSKSDDPEANGAEMLCYIPSSDTFNDTYHHRTYISGWHDYNSTINGTECTIKTGFQSTDNGKLAHRIFEVRINISALYNFNPDAFGVSFLGYGTMGIYTDAETQYWGASTYFLAALRYQDRIQEVTYFQCNSTYNPVVA